MNEFTNNPIDITQLPKFEEVQLKGAIKKISAVQIIYPIEVDKLKSKNHLIYV